MSLTFPIQVVHSFTFWLRTWSIFLKPADHRLSLMTHSMLNLKFVSRVGREARQKERWRRDVFVRLMPPARPWDDGHAMPCHHAVRARVRAARDSWARKGFTLSRMCCQPDQSSFPTANRGAPWMVPCRPLNQPPASTREMPMRAGSAARWVSHLETHLSSKSCSVRPGDGYAISEVGAGLGERDVCFDCGACFASTPV